MATPPPPPPPPLPPALDFLTVLSEARRIVNAHSRHFLALSVLFLLPLSFALAVYPLLSSPSSSADPNPATTESLLRLLRSDSKTPAAVLSYTAFISIFALFATASITHSTIQGFYGRPVKLLPSIKSAFTSFLPLSATVLCTNLVIALIVAILGFFVFLVLKSIELIQHQINYSSPYITVFTALIAVVFLLITFYLQVQWTLVNVLVVAESVWGFYPLKRSSYLVKGMRKVALHLILFFGSLVGFLLLYGSFIPDDYSSLGWKSWTVVGKIVFITSAMIMIMQLSLAAHVVLYMYCKAIHGELAMEIAEEFARDYVSLPFDNGKVPHVVSVAYT